MPNRPTFWQACALPVAAAIVLLSGLNALWNTRELQLDAYVPHALGVYLVTGLVALGLVWRAARRGQVGRGDLGVERAGWKPWKVIVGLALAALLGIGGFTNLPLPEGSGTPTFGDYGFWFTLILPAASLAELLVFLHVAYCLPEQWFLERGSHRWLVRTGCLVFASVTFGLYHYTHEPHFHQLVFVPLMPVMAINIGYFIATRNFWLTLVLHNAFAAVGFVAMQYHPPPESTPADELAYYTGAAIIVPTLAAFLIPLAGLVCLVTKCWPQRTATETAAG